MSGLDWGARVAQVAHELLDLGPFGWKVRREDYRDFCVRNFIDGGGPGVFGTSGTNCALFVRGCLVQAGLKPRGKRPAITGITSWLGVGWFREPEWIPLAKLDALRPGDILYWCGGPGKLWESTWKGATNGHVGIVLFDGDGWMHQTAEGGGKNHTCRKSVEPKDVRLSGTRPLRGVWRPDNMTQPEKAA